MTDEKRNEQRVPQTTPKLLMAFLRSHDGARRTYTVDRALPDNARIVGGQIYGNVIELVLELAEPIDSPVL